MIASLCLALYRGIWILVLPPVRLSAALGLAPRNWRVTERLDPGPPVGEGDGPLWMHCASLGEAKGLWAVARSLPPDLPLLLTATTAAGAGYLRRECEACGLPGRRARIAPFDHPGLLSSFLTRNRIRGLCLYELEIWPNALSACHGRGLPVVLASGRFTDRARRVYRRGGGALIRMLDRMRWIQAQSEADRNRFASATRAPVSVGADLKANLYLTPREVPEGPRPAFAFVSLHLAELRILLPILPALQARGEILVFPRHASEFAAFRAALRPLGFGPGSRHLLIDAFGRVGESLPRCHTAFVGGSLIPAGCHNLWEPLAAGARIVIGPHYRAQASLVADLQALDLIHIVPDPSALARLPPLKPEAALAARAYAGAAREAAGRALRECGERIIATFWGSAPAPRAAAVHEGGEGYPT